MKNKSLVLVVFASIVVIACIFYVTNQNIQKDVIDDQKKVGFIYIGPPGDHGWTYMHDVGRQYLEKELGDAVSTTYIENVPENADAVRSIRKLAESGHDLIFTTSFNYMDQTLEVAEEFPDVKFEHATGFKRQSDELPSACIVELPSKDHIGQSSRLPLKSSIILVLLLMF